MKSILFIVILAIYLISVFLIGSCKYVDKPEMTTTVQPASFSVSNLTIWPPIIQYIEDVDVSVTVTNTGGIRGIYEVVLLVNGLVDGAKSVAVEAGESEQVTFYIHYEPYGIYYVSIDGLVGSFEVVEPWPDGE